MAKDALRMSAAAVAISSCLVIASCVDTPPPYLFFAGIAPDPVGEAPDPYKVPVVGDLGGPVDWFGIGGPDPVADFLSSFTDVSDNRPPAFNAMRYLQDPGLYASGFPIITTTSMSWTDPFHPLVLGNETILPILQPDTPTSGEVRRPVTAPLVRAPQLGDSFPPVFIPLRVRYPDSPIQIRDDDYDDDNYNAFEEIYVDWLIDQPMPPKTLPHGKEEPRHSGKTDKHKTTQKKKAREDDSGMSPDTARTIGTIIDIGSGIGFSRFGRHGGDRGDTSDRKTPRSGPRD